MPSSILTIVVIILFILGYRVYGAFLAKRIFELNGKVSTPAYQQRDDIDYVPTDTHILFSHHFTSIAGTGPIVGPAIAVIWGWVPALIWIVVGAIVMGGVHDFGALVLSMRHQGKSIADLSYSIIGARARILFFLLIFFALIIVIAIFVLVIALLFEMFPQSVIPIWVEIPIAVLLGYAVYVWKKNVKWATFVAVLATYLAIVIGAYVPVKIAPMFNLSSLTIWSIILFIYAFFASVLPVWKLLQPRDYINGHQLIIIMVFLFLGILIVNPKIVAPALQMHPQGAPPIFPFIFITIACGAISGFHSLVSSGTSSKQIRNEANAKVIAYGGMLMEGVLAVFVLVAVAAGVGVFYKTEQGVVLTGTSAWMYHYHSWAQAGGLGAKVGAFVTGAANILSGFGISRTLAVTLIGVFVASFAGTTLDTATRIQRYIVNELAYAVKFKPLQGKYGATLFAIVSAAALTFSQGAGKGGLILWPLFGTVNQLLAGLVFLLLTVYLHKKGKPIWLVFLPMAFMLIVTAWAMVYNLNEFILGGKWHLVFIGGIIFVLQIWIVGEAVILFKKLKESNGK